MQNDRNVKDERVNTYYMCYLFDLDLGFCQASVLEVFVKIVNG